MKYVSLFAGIGGFDLALNRLGHECVYANDFDKYCKITYDKNFKTEICCGDRQAPKGNGESISSQSGVEAKGSGFRPNGNCSHYYESRNSGKIPHHPELDTTSITEVRAEDIPDHDLLVGGFPCQAFSIAGKRGGFEDTRGTLFFDVARIIKAKRPRYFILENVKGLLSHDAGRTFKTIIQTITELGYDCQWQVLNSKNFGVPQNRERVFIVGHIRGERRPEIFPIREDDRTVDERSQGGVQHVAGTLRARDYANWRGNFLKVGTLRTHKDGNGFREMKSGLAPTIPARAREDGSGQGVVAVPVLTPDRVNKRQNGRRFKEDGDPSFTLTAQDKHGVYDGMKIRRLTPTECERLQGFPDGWTEGVSDTQRYKQLGNAVTVNVVYEIAKRL